MWVQLIFAIVSAILSYAVSSLTSNSKKLTPALFREFNFPVPEEGAPQAVVFGDVWITGWQVLWVGNYNSTPIYSGGGGGKGK